MKVHVTKDGEKIKLCKMTDSHLDATIRLFERRAKEGITVGTGGGSCAEDMFYDEDTLYDEESLEVLEYDEYVKERDRRISIKKERRVKELETLVESLKLKWTKELPSKVGWYWRQSKLYDERLQCVEVRDYAGSLAIGNSVIFDDDFWNCYEWAGPIPAPED